MENSTRTPTRADTRTVIIETTARLLREEGADAVTTRGVASSAGVQAPTIYRLFGDKDGLLDAVAEHVLATYVADKSAAVETAVADGVDPVQDLRTGWESQIAFGLANPVLFNLMNSPGRGADSAAAQAGLAVLRARVHRVAVAGLLRVSERRAVDLIRSAGTGAVFTLLTTRPEDRDPGLAAGVIETVLNEILLARAEPADDAPMASLVAFRAIAPGLAALTDSERQLLTDWLDRAIAHG